MVIFYSHALFTVAIGQDPMCATRTATAYRLAVKTCKSVVCREQSQRQSQSAEVSTTVLLYTAEPEESLIDPSMNIRGAVYSVLSPKPYPTLIYYLTVPAGPAPAAPPRPVAPRCGGAVGYALRLRPAPPAAALHLACTSSARREQASGVRVGSGVPAARPR